MYREGPHLCVRERERVCVCVCVYGIVLRDCWDVQTDPEIPWSPPYRCKRESLCTILRGTPSCIQPVCPVIVSGGALVAV